jgi:hypothetical protein
MHDMQSGGRNITVPHKQNRCVFFDSELYHWRGGGRGRPYTRALSCTLRLSPPYCLSDGLNTSPSVSPSCGRSPGRGDVTVSYHYSAARQCSGACDVTRASFHLRAYGTTVSRGHEGSGPIIAPRETCALPLSLYARMRVMSCER